MKEVQKKRLERKHEARSKLKNCAERKKVVVLSNSEVMPPDNSIVDMRPKERDALSSPDEKRRCRNPIERSLDVKLVS